MNGAVVVSVFVSLIAIIGVLYFKWQDKKEAERNKHKENN